MVLPVNPNFGKDHTIDAENFIIYEMIISNPFSLKTVNNFNSSPPFGLYDIFKYLIYHSTDYDMQGLAVYISRLKISGLIPKMLKPRGKWQGIIWRLFSKINKTKILHYEAL